MGTKYPLFVEIMLSVSNLSVHEWGSCTPSDCDWGIQYTPMGDAQDGVLNLFWTPGFVERTQAIELAEPNRLKVTSDSHYIDGSGRPDVTDIYYFNK